MKNKKDVPLSARYIYLVMMMKLKDCHPFFLILYAIIRFFMWMFKRNFQTQILSIPVLSSALDIFLTFWDNIYKVLGGNFGLVFEAIFGVEILQIGSAIATTQTIFFADEKYRNYLRKISISSLLFIMCTPQI